MSRSSNRPRRQRRCKVQIWFLPPRMTQQAADLLLVGLANRLWEKISPNIPPDTWLPASVVNGATIGCSLVCKLFYFSYAKVTTILFLVLLTSALLVWGGMWSEGKNINTTSHPIFSRGPVVFLLSCASSTRPEIRENQHTRRRQALWQIGIGRIGSYASGSQIDRLTLLFSFASD